jgi:hypothetical protein
VTMLNVCVPVSQCSFFTHKGSAAEPRKVMYRRYASLFFIVGTSSEEVRGHVSHGALRPAPLSDSLLTAE